MVEPDSRGLPTSHAPNVIVLAGINGAGKTTASREVLAEAFGVLTFVNADVIAQGLSGFDPAASALEAGRIMLARLHSLAEERADFAFETTLAARSYAGWLDELRGTGYGVHLFYYWLNSADLAIARVAARVRAGGHHVPEATIRQRYGRSIRNLFGMYLPVVSDWKVYDNSHECPRLIAHGKWNEAETVIDQAVWDAIRRVAEHGQ
jgi:predicted ABC-type ATPase